MRTRKILTSRPRQGMGALLLGGLIGGALALLYAPRSGRETREYLAHQGQDRAERVKQSLRGAQENIRSRVENFRSRAEDMGYETRERLRDFEETATDMVEEERRNVGTGTTTGFHS